MAVAPVVLAQPPRPDTAHAATAPTAMDVTEDDVGDGMEVDFTQVQSPA